MWYKRIERFLIWHLELIPQRARQFSRLRHHAEESSSMHKNYVILWYGTFLDSRQHPSESFGRIHGIKE